MDSLLVLYLYKDNTIFGGVQEDIVPEANGRLVRCTTEAEASNKNACITRIRTPGRWAVRRHLTPRWWARVFFLTDGLGWFGKILQFYIPLLCCTTQRGRLEKPLHFSNHNDLQHSRWWLSYLVSKIRWVRMNFNTIINDSANCDFQNLSLLKTK